MERFDGTKSQMEHAVRIMDDFAYGIIAQREIEGRDGKNSADTDVSNIGAFAGSSSCPDFYTLATAPRSS